MLSPRRLSAGTTTATGARAAPPSHTAAIHPPRVEVATTMPTIPESIDAPTLSPHARCKGCGHAAYSHVIRLGADGLSSSTAEPSTGDCTCGCVKFEQRIRNPEAGRDWVVRVGFFCRNRWTEGEARVKAMGQVGAISKGLREVKKDKVPARSRVAQVKVVLIPVPRRTTR